MLELRIAERRYALILCAIIVGVILEALSVLLLVSAWVTAVLAFFVWVLLVLYWLSWRQVRRARQMVFYRRMMQLDEQIRDVGGNS